MILGVVLTLCLPSGYSIKVHCLDYTIITNDLLCGDESALHNITVISSIFNLNVENF